MNGWIERRGYPRASADFALRIHDAISIIEARVQDISCSGLYCQIKKTIPVMTKVAVFLLLPDPDRGGVDLREIRCQGVVVRSQPRAERDELFYDTAIFFTELKENDKEKIARYVNSKLASDANFNEGIT